MSVNAAVVGVTVTDALAVETVGAKADNVTVAVSGVATRLAVAVTVGANVVRLSVAVPGVTALALETLTVGANVLSVNATVVGVATWLAVAVTVGANVVSVSDAVDGVAVIGAAADDCHCGNPKRLVLCSDAVLTLFLERHVSDDINRGRSSTSQAQSSTARHVYLLVKGEYSLKTAALWMKQITPQNISGRWFCCCISNRRAL